MTMTSPVHRGFRATERGLWALVLDYGACSTSGLSPDDWYPISETAAAARQEAAAAIAVCATCPVRRECLALALRNRTVGRFGVWGGTVPAERVIARTADRQMTDARIGRGHNDGGHEY